MPDNPAGLPLSSVYPAEIDRFRAAGGRLLEIGLFGDRREHLTRSMSALFNLMRFAFYYAQYTEIDHVLIGVHPHHAPFYERCFGFKPFAAESVHPTVKNHAVVPLHLSLQANLALDPRPRGLTYCVENPLDDQAYENRFKFDPAQVANSPIGEFLRNRNGLSFPTTSDPRTPAPAA